MDNHVRYLFIRAEDHAPTRRNHTQLQRHGCPTLHVQYQNTLPYLVTIHGSAVYSLVHRPKSRRLEICNKSIILPFPFIFSSDWRVGMWSARDSDIFLFLRRDVACHCILTITTHAFVTSSGLLQRSEICVSEISVAVRYATEYPFHQFNFLINMSRNFLRRTNSIFSA